MDTDRGQISRNGIISKVPGGVQRDENDWQALRWNGDEKHGWHYGKFYQSTPMFFTAEGHNLWLGDHYRGRSLFLVSSGPSTKKLDLTQLNAPGVMTMGLNNSPKMFRPNMWTCVDSPASFLRSIWMDPTIQKFVPICSVDKPIFDNDSIVIHEKGKVLRDKDDNAIFDDKAGKFLTQEGGEPLRVRDCPNMMYYRRNEHFRAAQYLWEDTINWGNHGELGGARSVFLVAIRLAYLLGFRRVYLLGVDFDMSNKVGYSFKQSRNQGSVKGNNETYEKLVKRFTELKPIFDREGFEVFQCNKDSKFKVFPHLSYKDALKAVAAEFQGSGSPIDIATENTEGLYDREDRLKKAAEGQVQTQLAKKARAQEEAIKAAGAKAVQKLKGQAPPAKAAKAAKAPKEPQVYSPEDQQEVKARLDAARDLLQRAKAETADWMTKEPTDGNEAALTQWVSELKAMQTNEEQIRVVFRTIEDEKRYKHGEEIRWGLWIPENEEQV